MKIYLAGAITYHELNNELYKAMNWRNEVAQKLLDLNVDICENKFDWFNPTNNYEENLNYSYNSIVLQNKYYLDKCDIMIVNLDKLEHSPGTLFEMFYYYLNHKPIIAFDETKLLNQPHVHCSITEWFPDINNVIKYIKTMYVQ